MQIEWVLSQFYQEPNHPDQNYWIPFAASYGGQWLCPQLPANPATGWALVELFTTPHQLRAMALDSRIQLIPKIHSSKKLPQVLIDAYSSLGAKVSMTMGDLFELLEENVHPDFTLNRYRGGSK